VKEIRANPLLPWLVTQFPDVRLVWLVRHPLAVAASARSLGWDTHLDELVRQPDLVADHLGPLLPVIEAVDGPIERLVAQWCIENLVPFRMLAPTQVHLVFYEELVDRPVEVASDLLRAIGQAPDDAVRAAVERPSKLVRVESAVVQGGDLLSGWQRSLAPDEITAAAELVAAMGLGEVYGRDPRPDADAGRALLASRWPDDRDR
jgi:hypothetical protein